MTVEPLRGRAEAPMGVQPTGSSRDSRSVSFQDGGATGMFKRVGSAPWQASLGSAPIFCAEDSFPRAILRVWSILTTSAVPSECHS